jgi:NADP-dependent 3-hydroxy acid dehydrogenase YdfG/ferredoxin
VTLRADLSGQRALVTGASSGFGAHFARVLADAGAEVILAAWRTQALDSLAADITARGGAARSIALDVGDNGSVVAAVVAACEIDILINNAGVTNTKPVLEQTEADWDFVVGTNLNGAWLVATEVARAIKAGGGRLDHQHCLYSGSAAGRSGFAVRHFQSRCAAAHETAGARTRALPDSGQRIGAGLLDGADIAVGALEPRFYEELLAEIEGREDISVMENIRDSVGEVLALCGGVRFCATCHVYVDAPEGVTMPAMSEDEKNLLDSSSHHTAKSRLSCQLPFSADLSGLWVTVAPED